MRHIVSFEIYPISHEGVETLKALVKSNLNTKHASKADDIIPRLIQAAKGIGRSKLQKLLNTEGQTLAFISASRQSKSKKENKNRTEQLIRDLQEMGVRDFYTLKGRYEEEETGEMKSEVSIMPVGISFEDIMTLREKYDQDSIIFKGEDNMVGMYDGKDALIAKPLKSTNKKPETEKEKKKHEESNPYKKDRIKKKEVVTDREEKGESWTQFRNLGLNFDFLWNDPVTWGSDKKPTTVNYLQEKGFFDKVGIDPKGYVQEKSDWKSDKKKDKEKSLSVGEDTFLNTRVKSPETGNMVKIKSLKSRGKDTDAYKFYKKLREEWKKSQA
jgi:hypothetical protein